MEDYQKEYSINAGRLSIVIMNSTDRQCLQCFDAVG